MKNLLINAIVFSFITSAHASFFSDSCRHLKEQEGPLNQLQIKELKKDHRVVEHESMDKFNDEDRLKVLSNFFKELCKAPYMHRKLVKRRRLETHLTAGSITQHPYIQSLEEGPRGHTTDWGPVAGAGAVSRQAPTVIDIEKLYYGHGSKNLVIHEFAHVVDRFFNRYAPARFDISPTSEFSQIIADTPWVQLYGPYLTPYHKENPEEHFAELYARWYGSEETRAEVRALIPGAETLFDSLLQ